MSCRMQSDAESLRTRGNKHYCTGHYSEALSDYSSAIKLLESTTTPPSNNLLLSRLYHNRALSKTKLGDGERNDEKAEAQAAQADARRATELDPTYVKAWALFARLIEKAANREVKNVEEALDATHRVMELEVGLCNGDSALDALNTMGKLVRWELERQLEMTPVSDTMDVASLITWANQKVMRFYIKFSYFRQSVLNKILSPNVIDYGDSKSESWHRAKKIY